MKTAENIDAYIASYPEEIQKKLREIRAIIQTAAPGAEECISYGMPAYKQDGILVYFAANKNHIGFYPTSTGIRDFEHQLGEWKFSKGAVQFPYEKPLPASLITQMVQSRVAINQEKKQIKSIKNAGPSKRS